MTRNRSLFYVLAALLALLLLLLFLPLRVALAWSTLDESGVAARGAQGSVWAGEIESLQFGEFTFGTVGAAMRFWPLFVGRTVFDIYRPEGPGQPEMRAGIGTGGGGIVLDDAHATIGVGRLLSPLPVDRLQLEDVDLRFADGACAEAEGSVRAMFVPEPGGVRLPLDGLLGTARCDGEAVHIPMTGASGMERVDLRIFADGSYTARLRLTGDRSDEAELLSAAGFRAISGAYILEMEGSF